MKYLRQALKSKNSDGGSALALVLIMVVFISLLLSSVVLVTKSAQNLVQTSAAVNARKMNLMNGALQQALRELNFNPTTQTPRRWGVDAVDSVDGTMAIGRCSDKALNSYISGSDEVTVQCYEAKDSAAASPLASFILVGVGDSACGTSCTVGQDGGLAISNASSRCISSETSRVKVSGGIFNASGAWSGVDCSTLELVQKAGEDVPKITQPTLNTSNCPAFTKFTIASCVCPATTWLITSTDATGASNSNPCLSGVTYQDIDPNQSTSTTKAYLDYVNNLVDKPTYPATFEGTCSSPIMWKNPATNTPMSAVVWHPGTLGDTELAALKGQAEKQPGKSTSCGIKKVPIVFLPGAYRFAPTAAWEWKIADGTKVFGGHPNADTFDSATDCDTTAGNGVQFQFANASFVRIYTGSMFICGEGLKPSVSAPLNTGTTDYYWNAGSAKNSNNTNAFLTIDSSSAGAVPCSVVCFVSHGIVNAPAGWAKITLSGTGQYRFYEGAIFKAMSLSVNGSSVNGSDMAPPPLFDGDRYVQLRFWDKKNNRELGMVQVQIRDYFGQRIGSGYKIVYWRLN